MEFKLVDRFSWVELTDEQKKFVTSAEKINKNLHDYPDRYRVYEVWDKSNLVANVVLRFYPKTPSQVFLWDFAVDKKYQSTGYGTKVLLELEALLLSEGYSSLITTCMAGNSALSFYEKNGFKVTNEINTNENGRYIHEFDLEKTL